MEFCDNCGLILTVKKDGKKSSLVCRKCGYKSKDYKPLEIKEKVEKAPLDEVIVIEKSEEALPKTKTNCPKCSNKEAFWWMQQTRSADEAPTLFLRCVKCKHSWREYG
ncbi:MAG: transcription factor S [Candidatus Aenigmarchaeota archaeon]|nr:transcription factor S [Candidatus Aenigmarchaeota archaeon]